ncbi:hypothetical protein BV210_08645 [Halorientalis sp. IM1011]|uniref:hypothetical protein n=1 Tax=Halorientalis sp. IM1011 TaxID=1932360 RepID=UPI00097CD4A7|nr:hypothetical protein [Halorientalis sp. IM1011]AQL42774.1 hypothetical protein BV210_08645 [Halorientalis sp. IM1011]
MDVRDAVEADAGRLAELTGAPTDVMCNLVHDRTVRVAERDGEIVGFVSYDAREGTIHVTQLEGEPAICDRLLEEPVRFARGEDMAVELLVPEPDDVVQSAADDAGFDRVGSGPLFEGTPTVKYRLDG